MDINYYISHFASLNTNKRLGQVAPHKAIMLLSVIDLIEEKEIKWSCFELTDALEMKFHENWKRYVGTSILFKPIFEIAKLETTPSLGFLRNNGIKAGIDEDFGYN